MQVDGVGFFGEADGRDLAATLQLEYQDLLCDIVLANLQDHGPVDGISLTGNIIIIII